MRYFSQSDELNFLGDQAGRLNSPIEILSDHGRNPSLTYVGPLKQIQKKYLLKNQDEGLSYWCTGPCLGAHLLAHYYACTGVKAGAGYMTNAPLKVAT